MSREVKISRQVNTGGGSGFPCTEVTIVLKRRGMKALKLKFKPARLSHVWLSSSRALKQKGKKIIPGEHTFHQLEFITGK